MASTGLRPIKVQCKQMADLSSQEVALVAPGLADGPLEPGLDGSNVLIQIIACNYSRSLAQDAAEIKDQGRPHADLG